MKITVAPVRGNGDSMHVLVPLPDRDFDVTEVAAPCRLPTTAGREAAFATERAGTVPGARPVLFSRRFLAALEH